MRGTILSLGSTLRSNAIALLALFIALGGTATAMRSNGDGASDNRVYSANISAGANISKALPRNSVGPAQLRNNAVRPRKLANGAVRTPKLANEAVRAPKIASNAVVGSKIANGAVGGPKIATGAVDANNLANGAVTGAKLGNGVVSSVKLAPDALGSAGQVITVPRREVLAPGTPGSTDTVLHQSGPFTITGRCNRSASSNSATVRITTTENAFTLPLGSSNPPNQVSISPGGEHLLPPIVSSNSAGSLGHRGAASVWAISESGRYVNAGIFISRTLVSGDIRCVFGLTGFAN